MTINAGEAVTIPKEWTGVWETEGIEKFWVIYSESGEGCDFELGRATTASRG